MEMDAARLPEGELHEGVFLRDSANGTPILLALHGLGTDSRMWANQFEPFRQAGVRLMAVDIPGFGRSEFSGRRWTMAEAGKRILSALPRDTESRWILAGLSLGGVLAQQIALDHPERFDGLVLINTFACLRSGGLPNLPYLVGRFVRAMAGGPQAQAAFVAARIFPEPHQEGLRQLLIEQIVSANPKVYRAAMVELARFDARRRLREISIPTLVMTGTADSTVDGGLQKELADAIPRAIHLRLPGGHALPIDCPAEFNQGLLDFIQRFN